MAQALTNVWPLCTSVAPLAYNLFRVRSSFWAIIASNGGFVKSRFCLSPAGHWGAVVTGSQDERVKFDHLLFSHSSTAPNVRNAAFCAALIPVTPVISIPA
jgi:hypothetical protein